MTIDLTKYPTPRTDYELHDPFICYGEYEGMEKSNDGDWVPAHISEQLERENAALRDALTQILDAPFVSVVFNTSRKFARAVLLATAPK